MPAWLNGRGVATLQCYASVDLGLIAYESPAQEGMIVDEGVVVELVRPGTGEPVAAGEVGDVAFKPAGALPNDGKVIDDTRKYD